MKYIFIYETGIPYLSDKISDDDMEAFKDGLLDIIDVKAMKQLASPDRWVDIETRGIQG